MYAGFAGLMQLVRVKISQSKVRTGFVRRHHENLFQLMRRICRIVRLLECHSKIVAGIGGIGVDGQSPFVGTECCGKMSNSHRRGSEIVLSLKVRGGQLGGGWK